MGLKFIKKLAGKSRRYEANIRKRHKNYIELSAIQHEDSGYYVASEMPADNGEWLQEIEGKEEGTRIGFDAIIKPRTADDETYDEAFEGHKLTEIGNVRVFERMKLSRPGEGCPNRLPKKESLAAARKRLGLDKHGLPSRETKLTPPPPVRIFDNDDTDYIGRELITKAKKCASPRYKELVQKEAAFLTKLNEKPGGFPRDWQPSEGYPEDYLKKSAEWSFHNIVNFGEQEYMICIFISESNENIIRCAFLGPEKNITWQTVEEAPNMEAVIEEYQIAMVGK